MRDKELSSLVSLKISVSDLSCQFFQEHRLLNFLISLNSYQGALEELATTMAIDLIPAKADGKQILAGM